MSEPAFDPVEVDATFTDPGHLQLTDDSAALVAAQLGHEPRPGDVVHLSVRRTVRRQGRGSGRPGERGTLAHLAHLAEGFDADDARAVREEMTAESERTRWTKTNRW
ncbi:MAG: hypothetical protein J2P18_08545 [Nocardia sp.]|nr:hypothetical protein [Nocardia sp.]